MSRYFRLAEEAKNHGVMMTGASPKTTSLVEDDALKVQSALGFLSDSTTPEDRKRIEKDMQGQKGYRFKNKDNIDVAIVVAPFRDGFCVWGVLPNGVAIRF